MDNNTNYTALICKEGFFLDGLPSSDVDLTPTLPQFPEGILFGASLELLGIRQTNSQQDLQPVALQSTLELPVIELPTVELPTVKVPTVDDYQEPPYIYGTPGNDTIEGEDIAENIIGLGGNDTIYGNGGSDFIRGNDGNDFIRGGSGFDVLLGYGGDDYLDGGEDDDGLDGGEGNDVLFGGSGNDRLYGEDGDDQLSGAEGDDILDGGKGNDGFQGGAGNDTILAGEGNDYWVAGDEGNDHICGGAGDDQLFGNVGDDLLYGGLGIDYVRGGAGSDWIQGAAENSIGEFDILVGGADPGDTLNPDGADTFVLGNTEESFYSESNLLGPFDPFGPDAMFDGYATIQGFNREVGDTIQLHGDESSYVLGQGEYGGDRTLSDTVIYRQTGFNYERIGVVIDVADLSLSADVSFV